MINFLSSCLIRWKRLH